MFLLLVEMIMGLLLLLSMEVTLGLMRISVMVGPVSQPMQTEVNFTLVHEGGTFLDVLTE